MHKFNCFFCILSALFLISCGGGGGGESDNSKSASSVNNVLFAFDDGHNSLAALDTLLPNAGTNLSANLLTGSSYFGLGLA